MKNVAVTTHNEIIRVCPFGIDRDCDKVTKMNLGGIAVFSGLLLLITSLWLPSINEAFFEKSQLAGWKITLIGASALFSITEGRLDMLLGGLFAADVLLLLSIILFPFLRGAGLHAFYWLCITLSILAVVVTLVFLSSTNFAVGHYVWMSGFFCVAYGFHCKLENHAHYQQA